MFWKLNLESAEPAEEFRPHGRFVLHRHHDVDGAHLDLRLEAEGYAVGFRIAADALADGAWATEKMPHPLVWLDRDGDAVREDAGAYRVVGESAESRAIELHGEHGVRVVRFTREGALDAAAARDIASALQAEGLAASHAGTLLRDGAAARRQSMERLCGLGCELDGDLFDEAQWRALLANRSLADIEAQCRTYQARFDAKYPPAPVSKPEPLEDSAETERMLALVRGA